MYMTLCIVVPLQIQISLGQNSLEVLNLFFFLFRNGTLSFAGT